MSDFCTDFLARESKAKEGEESDRATRAPDVLCVTEEFGTRAVNEVGILLFVRLPICLSVRVTQSLARKQVFFSLFFSSLRYTQNAQRTTNAQ